MLKNKEGAFMEVSLMSTSTFRSIAGNIRDVKVILVAL